jgi:hypothetical protein
MRRFTRLTNEFLNKLENHAYSVALHQMYYNFVRTHQTLKITLAMAAGVTDELWEVSNIVAMVEAWEAYRAATGIEYQTAILSPVVRRLSAGQPTPNFLNAWLIQEPLFSDGSSPFSRTRV